MKKILKIIISILILIPIFLGSILIFTNGNLKYTEEIEIQSSTEIVDQLFSNIYNMKKYIAGTKDIILIDGMDGVEGAEYKIIWEMGKESMEMKGTLKDYNLPDSITFVYEMPGIVNTVTQKHHMISENRTLIINEQEFQFSGVMEMVAFFKPNGFNINSFKAQTKIYLEAFKSFVENNTTTVLKHEELKS